MKKQSRLPILMSIAVFALIGVAPAIWAWQNPSSEQVRVNTVASIIVAAATLLLAGVSVYQIHVARQQLRENQEAAHRPFLVPEGMLPTGKGPSGVWTETRFSLEVRNVGSGLATNICAVLLPPAGDKSQLPKQFSCRARVPVGSLSVAHLDFGEGGTMFSWEDTVAGHSFSIPSTIAYDPSRFDQINRREMSVARLTLTCADIFGIKHCFIYDFTSSNTWIATAYLPGVEQDIRDLDVEKSPQG